jgi:hypothetical protein
MRQKVPPLISVYADVWKMVRMLSAAVAENRILWYSFLMESKRGDVHAAE